MSKKANHQISLDQAIAMTTLYRANRPVNFPICETFDKDTVTHLLSNPKAASFRIYYGMKEDKSVHAILVAADANGNDILPAGTKDLADNGGDILEDAFRCPDICPPDSPLNS